MNVADQATRESRLHTLREQVRAAGTGAGAIGVAELREFAALARTAADGALVGRALKRLPADAAGLRTVRVAVLRTCTIEPLVPFIEAAGVARGIRPVFVLGDFNSIAQDILGGDGRFERAPVDVVILWVRLADLHPDFWHGYGRYFPDGTEAVLAEALERVIGWVRGAAERWGRPVVVTNFEQPRGAALGLFDAVHPRGQRPAIAELNRRLGERVQAVPGATVLDLAGAQAQVGLAQWFDEKMAAFAGLPYAAAAYPTIADATARTLRALVTPPRKCLVVDLDNTLWQGVLGEDGADGIKVGEGYPGALYQDFQRQILALRDRGILLAIASKNNPEETLAVLANHGQMILRPAHFAAVRINWNDKTQSLREIAAELNIGTDALVFLDDNPAECTRVRQAMPEVLTVPVPADPLRLGEVLRQLDAFDALTLSREDRARGAMYQEQAKRQELRGQAGSLEDYYRSLKMVLTIGEVGPPTLARVAQLTQKTNQFNLTTRRYTEEQVARLAADGAHRVFWTRVEDAFGDNGLVAVAMVERAAEHWDIINFLMSCRVIQRTVETALLAHVAAQARAAGVGRLRGEIIPTAKNEPARDFYRRHGFTLAAEETGREVWTAELAELKLDSPPWFTVVLDLPPS